MYITMHGTKNIKYECQLRMFSVQCWWHCRTLALFRACKEIPTLARRVYQKESVISRGDVP